MVGLVGLADWLAGWPWPADSRSINYDELRLSINIKPKHFILISILIGLECVLGHHAVYAFGGEFGGASAALNPKME